VKVMVIAWATMLVCCAGAHADNDVWNNTTKHARSDAALQSAVDACSQKFGDRQNGTETSSQFKRCMLGKGWRYSATQSSREDTWIDPETGLTCRHSTFMGVPSSECSNI
jgi:hypothetical protein